MNNFKETVVKLGLCNEVDFCELRILDQLKVAMLFLAESEHYSKRFPGYEEQLKILYIQHRNVTGKWRAKAEIRAKQLLEPLLPVIQRKIEEEKNEIEN